MLNISQYDSGKTTAFILPLLAMHGEYEDRARQYRLSCESWQSESPFNEPPQVLLVAVEQCTWEALKAYLRTLHQLGRLARVVVDEVHLLLKHGAFRPCMSLLQFLGCLSVPIVLMTATCPPNLEKDAFEKIGRFSFSVIRTSTHRPEIQQRFVQIEEAQDEEQLQRFAVDRIQALIPSLAAEDRMLLFCLSHSDCDQMAKALGWQPYHAHVILEDRAESMRKWKAGEIQGLACTSMLNCCLDYAHVRYVFHLGPPRDAIDYSQAIGRCSRDGRHGTSIVYHRPRRPWHKSTGEDKFGVTVIHGMINDPSMCHNFALTRFLDGHGTSCFSQPNSALCDRCEEAASPSSSTNEPTAPQAVTAVHPIPAFPSPASLNTAFAAAYSHAQGAPHSNDEEEFGGQIRLACDILYKCCVFCWLGGRQSLVHRFDRCPFISSEDRDGYEEWVDGLELPDACCFYCGGPQRVSTESAGNASAMLTKPIHSPVEVSGFGRPPHARA